MVLICGTLCDVLIHFPKIRICKCQAIAYQSLEHLLLLLFIVEHILGAKPDMS